MATAAPEQLGAEPVDEDDDRSPGRVEVAITGAVETGDPEARRHRGEQPVEQALPKGGQGRGWLHRQPPTRAERSRAKAVAASSAPLPSASALIRSAMSSAVTVPS